MNASTLMLHMWRKKEMHFNVYYKNYRLSFDNPLLVFFYR